MSELVADPFDVRRALGVPDALRAFNEAGVLVAADVHVALRLAALAGEDDPAVTLAAALAVRGPRLGHVYVDLASARDTTVVDVDEPVDVGALPWPGVDDWVARLVASPLVAAGAAAEAGDGLGGGTAAEAGAGAATVGSGVAPLRLAGTRLYLDRYWREEQQLAADLRAFAEAETGALDGAALDDGLARLFGGGDDDGLQRLAAESAVRRQFAVVAGGPGTGKTTTVARIVALLAEQAVAAGAPPPLVALAAPTGKAAARLEEAVHDEAAKLDVADEVRAALLGLEASTLHRLLGRRRGSHSRFRHHRGNRLPHDVVVVDETSMVPLSLMARLVEAVRPEARLVLVGDPGQLSSIEAGAVLGDIVGEAGAGRDAAGGPEGPAAAGRDAAVGPEGRAGIVVLDRVHRFGGGIASLASAVRGGEADRVVEVLASQPDGVTWVPAAIADPAALALVRERAVATARAVFEAAAAGRVHDALAALGAFRLLCAHRRGPYGVDTWMPLIESWLAAEIAGFSPEDRWYVGRPLLVTENDYGLRLYNGDTGVVVASGENRLRAAFERRGEVLQFSPSRLDKVETVYAMTIHKSQGSQFATAAVLLPDPASRLLTRELLYTAITRAREELIVVGGEESIRAAVARPVARASGLGRLLWG